MIKIICDRCGKDIEDAENEIHFTGTRNTAHGYDECINLCDFCLKRFRKWLEEKGGKRK